MVGRGAIERLEAQKMEILEGIGEEIPLPDESVEVVFSRQVLHHIPDLVALSREVHRVLRPGGIYLACREHVVESQADLEIFLANHAVHQLAGGEGACSAQEYRSSREARGGLRVRRSGRHWTR